MNKLEEHPDNDKRLSEMMAQEIMATRRVLRPTAEQLLEDVPLTRVVFK